MSDEKCFILPYSSQELIWARLLFHMLSLWWIYLFLYPSVHLALFWMQATFSLINFIKSSDRKFPCYINCWMDDQMDEQVGEQPRKLFILIIFQFEWYLSCWNVYLLWKEGTKLYCLRCYTAQCQSLTQSVKTEFPFTLSKNMALPF